MLSSWRDAVRQGWPRSHDIKSIFPSIVYLSCLIRYLISFHNNLLI